MGQASTINCCQTNDSNKEQVDIREQTKKEKLKQRSRRMKILEETNSTLKIKDKTNGFETQINKNSFWKVYETNICDEEQITLEIPTGDNTNDQSRDIKSLVPNKLTSINVDSALNLTEEARVMLEEVDSFSNFNIFDFKDEVNEQELFVLSTYLMHKHNLFQQCKIDPEVYFRFIKRIQDHYNPKWIEYHNKTHGADVCQTTYFFLQGCDFLTIGNISDHELMSIIISSSCHDFEHPGLNNGYLVNARSPWALRYNDKSPLENHHIAATFMVLESPEFRLFNSLSQDEYKQVRKNMIEIVLATDMAHHFSHLEHLKKRIAADDFAPDGDDKMTVVKSMVHFADISNPGKPFNMALTWTGLLYDEFFKQGDRESEVGMNISFLMDRKTTNIASASAGFIQNVIKPAYVELVKIIPKANFVVENLEENTKKWRELEDQYEKKKEDNQNYVEESRGVIKYDTDKVCYEGNDPLANTRSLMLPSNL